MQLTKKQEDGLRMTLRRYHNKEKYVVIGGYAGTGKALPNEDLIPTPQGWKKIKEIKIGDYLFNQDGKPTKVIGVYPQQEKKAIWKVIFEDGRIVQCCKDHLWEYIDVRNNRFAVDTIERIYQKSKRNSWKYSIRLGNAAQYKDYENRKDLYSIGCEYAKFDNKSIPQEFLLSNIEQRLSLLRGLLDTKGDVTVDGEIVYNTCNDLLAKDVQKLCYSLGFKAIAINQNTEIQIKIDCQYNIKKTLFLNEDKKQKVLSFVHPNAFVPCLTIVDIVPTQEYTEMTCFQVEDKKHLFLTGDYIVTHNTTLVSAIVDALINFYGVQENEVVFTSFTGKATQELLKKGNKNVCTLHKLLYHSKPLPDGRFMRKPKTYIPYKVVIVDEISMVPNDLLVLLASMDCFVICLGDPMQLPPVSEKEDNHLLDSPHIFLDEIMRQAQESEIIRLSMKIREGHSLEMYKGSEVQVLPKKNLYYGMYEWADQILVGTNKTRNRINQEIRLKSNKSLLPEEGDKIICLRNYWDCLDNEENPLINGTIGYFTSDVRKRIMALPPLHKTIPIINGSVKTETGSLFYPLTMDEKLFSTGEKALTPQEEYSLFKKRTIPPFEFTYGYAITYWKSQGSEFDKVLAIEESFPFDRETHIKALYTACTRAKEKLVLIKR